MDNFSIYSDLFKDVNGIRPRGVLAEQFKALSLADQSAELDRLSREIVEDIIAEADYCIE
jgi:hypothetical protein